MTPPLLLSVDTASARGVVVLSRGDVVLAASTYLAGSDHAEKLLDHVRDVLARGACTLESVEGFGLGVGPGSFTGVRVGVATIKAFALVFPRPVSTVSTLAVLVEAAAETAPAVDDERVGAMLSAGREDVFVGLLTPGSTSARAACLPRVDVVSHANLAAFFAENDLRSVVGAGAKTLLPGCVDRSSDDALPTPAALARLVERAPRSEGRAVVDLEPAYARPPQITASRPRLPAV